MNKKDIVLISEFISTPFDEGLKNVLFNVIRSIQKNANSVVVTKIGNMTDGLDIKKIKLNKLFLNDQLYSFLKETSPHVILYIPEASCTFNSFIRAKILKMMCRHASVFMLGVQYRTYSKLQSFLMSYLLKPDMLFLLSRKNETFYADRGINVKVLPPAVNCEKFFPADEEEKKKIRVRYKIPLDKRVILHVGHIKANRNIECLLEVQKLKGTQVVVVGSTSIMAEINLKDKLLNAGIHVIDTFIPDISDIYNMSDLYVFPVLSSMDAIDMPMSVLEAMACNLPVITTRFGALPDYFNEDEGFRYMDSNDDLMDLLYGMKFNNIHNTEKVKGLNWDNFTNKVILAFNALK